MILLENEAYKSISIIIALALELQGQKATKEIVLEVLRQVELEAEIERMPYELSGGQKQRVAIARALIKNPKILLADEPTGSLDSETSKQILELLKKLSKDKLVLIVSHDREFAYTYGDRVIELADGRIIKDSNPQNSPALISTEVKTIKKAD
jgi:putative ABC transport system permease protein